MVSQSPKKRVLSRANIPDTVEGLLICLNPLKSGSYPEIIALVMALAVPSLSQSPKKRVLSRELGVFQSVPKDYTVSIP